MKPETTIGTHENENYIENAEDILSKLETVTTFYGPAKTQLLNSLTWMACSGALRAGLAVSKATARANRKANSNNPGLAALLDAQRDEMAEQVKDPEVRYDHQLELARYFYHTCPTGNRPDLYDLAMSTLSGGNPRKAALKYVEDHLDLKGEDAVEYLRKRNMQVNNPHEAQLVDTGKAILAPATPNDNPWMNQRDYLSFLRSVENNISATKESNNKSGLLEQLLTMDSRIDWDPEALSADTFVVKGIQQELVVLIENFEASTTQEEQKQDQTDADGKPAMA